MRAFVSQIFVVIKYPVRSKQFIPILSFSGRSMKSWARATRCVINIRLSIVVILLSHFFKLFESINHASNSLPIVLLRDLPYPASIGWTISVVHSGKNINRTWFDQNISLTSGNKWADRLSAKKQIHSSPWRLIFSLTNLWASSITNRPMHVANPLLLH